MKIITSGSIQNQEDLVVGTLSFLESGMVSIKANESEDFERSIKNTFLMTADFIFYALQKSEWLLEFSRSYVEKLDDPDANSEVKTSRTKNTSHLTLIKGGLSESEE